MTHPDIVRAIQSLVAQGKTPSMALLKARLGGTVPMPALIQALRQFKQDPAQFQASSETETSTSPASEPDLQANAPNEPTLKQLYDEIRALRTEVAKLRTELKRQ